MGANKKFAISDQDRLKIVAMYKHGYAIEDITARFGCNRSSVLRLVKEAGEETRQLGAKGWS